MINWEKSHLVILSIDSIGIHLIPHFSTIVCMGDRRNNGKLKKIMKWLLPGSLLQKDQ